MLHMNDREIAQWLEDQPYGEVNVLGRNRPLKVISSEHVPEGTILGVSVARDERGEPKISVSRIDNIGL
jgi:hypothetical protein